MDPDMSLAQADSLDYYEDPAEVVRQLSLLETQMREALEGKASQPNAEHFNKLQRSVKHHMGKIQGMQAVVNAGFCLSVLRLLNAIVRRPAPASEADVVDYNAASVLGLELLTCLASATAVGTSVWSPTVPLLTGLVRCGTLDSCARQVALALSHGTITHVLQEHIHHERLQPQQQELHHQDCAAAASGAAADSSSPPTATGSAVSVAVVTAIPRLITWNNALAGLLTVCHCIVNGHRTAVEARETHPPPSGRPTTSAGTSTTTTTSATISPQALCEQLEAGIASSRVLEHAVKGALALALLIEHLPPAARCLLTGSTLRQEALRCLVLRIGFTYTCWYARAYPPAQWRGAIHGTCCQHLVLALGLSALRAAQGGGELYGMPSDLGRCLQDPMVVAAECLGPDRPRDTTQLAVLEPQLFHALVSLLCTHAEGLAAGERRRGGGGGDGGGAPELVHSMGRAQVWDIAARVVRLVVDSGRAWMREEGGEEEGGGQSAGPGAAGVQGQGDSAGQQQGQQQVGPVLVVGRSHLTALALGGLWALEKLLPKGAGERRGLSRRARQQQQKQQQGGQQAEEEQGGQPRAEHGEQELRQQPGQVEGQEREQAGDQAGQETGDRRGGAGEEAGAPAGTGSEAGSQPQALPYPRPARTLAAFYGLACDVMSYCMWYGMDTDSNKKLDVLSCMLDLMAGVREEPEPFPLSPSRRTAAAVAGGYLPCLTRLVRRAARNPGRADTRLVRRLLPGNFLPTYPPMAHLLAFSSTVDAASFITSLGKLLSRAGPAVLEGVCWPQVGGDGGGGWDLLKQLFDDTSTLCWLSDDEDDDEYKERARKRTPKAAEECAAKALAMRLGVVAAHSVHRVLLEGLQLLASAQPSPSPGPSGADRQQQQQQQPSPPATVSKGPQDLRSGSGAASSAAGHGGPSGSAPGQGPGASSAGASSSSSSFSTACAAPLPAARVPARATAVRQSPYAQLGLVVSYGMAELLPRLLPLAAGWCAHVAAMGSVVHIDDDRDELDEAFGECMAELLFGTLQLVAVALAHMTHGSAAGSRAGPEAGEDAGATAGNAGEPGGGGGGGGGWDPSVLPGVQLVQLVMATFKVLPYMTHDHVEYVVPVLADVCAGVAVHYAEELRLHGPCGEAIHGPIGGGGGLAELQDRQRAASQLWRVWEAARKKGDVWTMLHARELAQAAQLWSIGCMEPPAEPLRGAEGDEAALGAWTSQYGSARELKGVALPPPADAAAALMPLRRCGNPLCVNVAGDSEPELLQRGLKRCARCGVVEYCSRECQTVHWRAGHKADCAKVAAAAAAKGPGGSVGGAGGSRAAGGSGGGAAGSMWRALVEAARAGNEEAVRRELKRRKDAVDDWRLQERDHLTRALAVAVVSGHVPVVGLLLEAGLEPNASLDNAGITALHLAAQTGHVGVVQELLARGACVDVLAEDGRTPLCDAARYGRADVVRALLAAGADVNVKADVMPLFAAALCHHPRVVAQLLEAGAPVNAQGSVGNGTALHCAAWNGSSAMVGMLLAQGADPNAADKNGRTPLGEAASCGQLKIAQRLLDHGANVKRMGPLHDAAKLGHNDVVRLLAQRGAPLDARDKKGATPLIAAVAERQDKTIKLLLELGADPNIPNYGGTSALHVAAEQGRIDVVRQLLKAGANKHAKTAEGRTPRDVAQPWAGLQALLK